MKSTAAFLALQPCSSYTVPRRSSVRTAPHRVTATALQSTTESTFDDWKQIDLSLDQQQQLSTLPTEALSNTELPAETIDAIAALSSNAVALPIAESAETTQTAIETPTVRKILAYTLPAIGVWMCSPILSMIDTAAVGMLAGTAQQAALNPAVSVTDYGGLVVAFMYTATTNLIAAAQQHDKSNPEQSRTTTTLLTGLRLSILVGSIFAIVLSCSAKTLIQTLIGNELLDPQVMEAALRYVRIRSLGMPAALVIGTAQSACLGMQDVKSPLLVLMAAAAINFLGDVFLVGKSNLWLGGAAGAAWATVFSQYGALYMFWRWMVKPVMKRVEGKKEVVDVSKSILELTGTSKEGSSRRKRFRDVLKSNSLKKKSFSYTNKTDKTVPKSRGFLAGKLKIKEFLRPSNFDTQTAKEYLPFVIPVTTTSIGRISGYIAMSHVASSTLGTFDMAAHQIIFSIFCCLTPIVDGLSQVAQSFVPGVFEYRKSKERAAALSKTIMNFRKVGVAFGGVLVSLAACIPLISRYFTTDAMVLNRVNGAIPGVAMFLLVNGLMCAGEGSLLGQKDLRFLRNMYTVFFFTVPAYMLRLKKRSLLGIQEVSIGTMWAAFSTYNVIRTCIWHLRLAQLQRRTNKGVAEAS